MGELDLSAILRFEGVFAPLKDLNRFRELRVHPDLGTIYWPNGADLDPAVLYARVTGTPIPTYKIKAGSRKGSPVTRSVVLLPGSSGLFCLVH